MKTITKKRYMQSTLDANEDVFYNNEADAIKAAKENFLNKNNQFKNRLCLANDAIILLASKIEEDNEIFYRAEFSEDKDASDSDNMCTYSDIKDDVQKVFNSEYADFDYC